MSPEILNIGGGFPCSYVGDDASPVEKIAQNALAEYNMLDRRPRLILEPGRRIVADAAVLVTTVIARIERDGKTWLFLDAGVYNALFEALSCQGSTRYPVSCCEMKSVEQQRFVLAGPTGDGLDVITRDAILLRDVSVGDRLMLHNVGAYSLVFSSRFNGFELPAVHFV